MPKRHWLQLALTEGVGPVLTARLIEQAGSVEGAVRGDPSILRQVEGIGGAKAAKIAAGLRAAGEEVDRELDRAAAVGASIVCRDDPEYPPLLKEIPDPPPVL